MIGRLCTATAILSAGTLLALTACSSLSFTPFVSNESVVAPGGSPVVMVSLAEGGRRGDLGSLMQQNKDLAGALSTALAPRVARYWQAGYEGEMAVAAFDVVGATRKGDEIWFYAHESLETFAIVGGRLTEQGGESAPLRVRSSLDLKVLAYDVPSDADYDEGRLTEYMPSWALSRADPHTVDMGPLLDAAWRWAKNSGRLPQLVAQARPVHADPHHHSPDVYTLGALPTAINGFAIKSVTVPSPYIDAPDPDDLLATSPDSRFACYWASGSGLLFHDVQADRWYHLDGPGVGHPLFEDCAWTGHVLAFDQVDVGFSEPRTRPMTMVHVEVDLDSLQVERVVPIGPFTLNGSGGEAPPATVPLSSENTSWFTREYYPAFEEWRIQQQTADSEIVVVGKVAKVDPSLWNSPDGKAWPSPPAGVEPVVYTTFYVEPEKVLKGTPASGTLIAFRATGGYITTGAAGSQNPVVEAGTLRLEVGDRVALFGTTQPRWGDGGDYRPAGAYWLTLENSSVWKETDGWFDFQGVTNGMGEDSLSQDALEMRVYVGS